MNLPPMSAIRAFEAAARHQSFTRAAEELGMTQAAVSYQIKVLEDRVGAPLFVRLPRQVVLTAKGAQLAPAVSNAFLTLHSAFRDLIDKDQGTLSVTTMTTFAASWLIPRLGRFKLAHPDIAVQISISDQLADLTGEQFDIGIRTGIGVWSGLEAHHLMPSRFTPVCSPSLIKGKLPYKPEEILELPLLSPQDPWWQTWFEHAGYGPVDLSNRPGHDLGIQQFEGMAAMAGQGVALVNTSFFAGDIAAGRLVRLSDVVATNERPYWLVYPKARQKVRKIQAFRDWILNEMGEQRD